MAAVTRWEVRYTGGLWHAVLVVPNLDDRKGTEADLFTSRPCVNEQTAHNAIEVLRYAVEEGNVPTVAPILADPPSTYR